MKKFILLFVAGLMVAGVAFAQDENGALGFGFIGEGSKSNKASFRGSIFLDAGTKLYGPFHYGFEIQGDVKKLDQSSFDMSQTDVTLVGITSSSWVAFYQVSQYTQTYTLWDLDISPRGYLSFDLGDKVQLLGFAGLNYNWQTLDYKLKVNSGAINIGGRNYTNGDEYTDSSSTDGTFDVVAGARVTVGAFYLDYTRFLRANDSGDYSFNTYNKDRLGLGINLRF